MTNQQRPNRFLTLVLALAPLVLLALIVLVTFLAMRTFAEEPTRFGVPIVPSSRAPIAFPTVPDPKRCPAIKPASAAPADGDVVVLGASIALGMRTSKGTETAWPHLLATRLRQAHIPIDVVNDSIGGERLLTDNAGHKCTSALLRQVPGLALPGVRTLILTDVINDIQQPPHVNSPQEIIAGLKRFVTRAHANGVRVIGTTITPYRGLSTYQTAGDRCRHEVNKAMRHDHLFDGLVDFSAALRDPSGTSRILSAYDSGDHLHPDDAGQDAMARAIPLQLLTSAPSV
ncbi:GDSL-type esterase/lipase family protein [Streptomyces sp. RB6PN25]|uniref:GDSL-type esterase/lipase family protein n=1 Tax=Streptomyces humicola TaxID=2953240 RepID=A0ABT1Q2A1_9ACTN|nr:GDSL-type esterase/lipase family protein [Streptomyces humicola]MCQ4084058.1 GDSL-type esterase/lipase family protein [Streptomyces humicola]